MITKFASANAKVISLVGGRGRKVKEFIEDYLGEEGLENAIIIVSTSDEAALAQRQAAYTVMAINKYFCNLRNEVICIIDNITRFAMAQGGINLSLNEATTGSPSVFAELPKLFKRASLEAENQESTTGLFSVFVEGDDNNEPVADAVRSILDDHIVLDRKIANKGRYPAVNILQSITRIMQVCNTSDKNQIILKAKQIITIYEDMIGMIRIGAYKIGNGESVEAAIKLYLRIEFFLSQKHYESKSLKYTFQKLAEIVRFETEVIKADD